MWQFGSRASLTPNVEAVRKRARILVIDDHVFPAQKIFENDGYHFERWAEVQNLRQLTDGDYDLILLDIQGVGLRESPDQQGLGILRAIKKANPSQAVFVYSSQPQTLAATEYLILADAVFDKGSSYVTYKEKVDEILTARASPSYFIAAMNRELGQSAALAPRAVQKALKSFKRGNPETLTAYLGTVINDREKIATIGTIISVGIEVAKAVVA